MTMIEKVVNAIRDSFNSNDIDCYPLAKAAIEAMREPTKEMLEAARTNNSTLTYENMYIIMVDAALKARH